MLIGVQDELRRGDASPLNCLVPAFEGVMVLVEDRIDRPVGPTQQLIESVERPVEKPEVVEVDIQDGGQGGSNQNVFILGRMTALEPKQPWDMLP